MTYDVIEIGNLMLRKGGSVNPLKFQDETFELYSIPSYDKQETEIIKGKDIGSTKQIVQCNDVMISKIVPHIRRAWVVNESKGYRQIASGEWIVFRSEKIYPNYLRHLLISDFFNKKFMETVSGVGGSLLRARPAFVGKILIPLPPLEEQRRIASILDKADAIRQKRQQAIAKLDELLQATFIDMFGDESNDYKGIDKVNLLDKVDFLTGFAFKSNDFKSSGIKLCRGINVLTGYLDWNSTAYWDSSEHDKFKKFELKKDDIVIAMDRPWISSGFKISMIGEEDKDILLVQRVARLRSKESSYSNFIYHLLDSHNFKNHCNVTETTIPHISPTDFKTFLIPDASQSQILKFDKFAKAVRAQKQAMRISLEKSNDFFNSLQQKAFNGTL
ncbi:restriction endonuclease subunit S [Acinetobacter lwoffii]|uniref:restriction endonuclease subunit S n=1 Tax=Acinetobacter lwoffii TaxID=28090 RepID=UPI002098616F|nr:restriction endonuclease subunit S [Acinetobacter lwoffii]MCO8069830.1 restriction endonuclease subunit S [Acinetobacter lwoffii]